MGWKKGQVVLTSEPYAHVLSHKFRRDRCSYCFQTQESVKKCTGCGVLRYCGRTCQRQDWSIHREECKCLQRVAPNTPTDSVLLMLRLIIRSLQGQDKGTVDNDGGLRTFEQLMSHEEEIKQDAARCEIFSKMCFTLSKLVGSQLPLPDSSQLLSIFGKMVINTFTIADQEMQDVGSAVYLSPSCLDHRCTANAVVTFRGKKLYIHAVDDIPDGHLAKVHETVFLSYVDQLAPSWERQKQLQEQYYFVCQCSRCQDSALDKKMTGGKQKGTTKQGAEQEAEEKERDATLMNTTACQTVIDKVDRLKASAEDESSAILSLCRDCLSRVRTALLPSNVYMLRILDRAFDAAIACALWEEALTYVLETLPAYRTLLPSCNPHLAVQLMRAGKLQLWLDQLPQAFSHLSQAEVIVAVTHGKDSELYSQLAELLRQSAVDNGAGASRPAIGMS